jgi:hypothetical protein
MRTLHRNARTWAIAGLWALASLGCATAERAVETRREIAIYPLAPRADTPKRTQRLVTSFVNTTTQYAKSGQARLELKYDGARELSRICVEFADPEVAAGMLAPLRTAEKLRVVEEACMDPEQP